MNFFWNPHPGGLERPKQKRVTLFINISFVRIIVPDSLLKPIRFLQNSTTISLTSGNVIHLNLTTQHVA